MWAIADRVADVEASAGDARVAPTPMRVLCDVTSCMAPGSAIIPSTMMV